MIPRVFPGRAARLRRLRRRELKKAEPEPQEWLLEHRPSSYWEATRRPFPSLLFVAPLAMAYESAVFWMSGHSDPSGSRTGADAWMCQALTSVGLSHPWFLPLLLVVILLGWQVSSKHDWRFSPAILGGMTMESVTWAIALLGIGRLIDLAFSYLEQGRLPILAVDPTAPHHPGLSALVGYLGAGVYEETLFRLMLIPAFFGAEIAPDAAGLVEQLGRDRFGTALRPGSPCREPRRGVHLVPFHLPMDGGGVLRLGLHPARFRDRRRHAYGLRYLGRVDWLEVFSFQCSVFSTTGPEVVSAP